AAGRAAVTAAGDAAADPGMRGGAGAAVALQTGGTLGLHALYIHRKEDDRAFALLRGHEYCNILTTRQMGKSSLMTRLRARLAGEGVKTIAFDLAGDIGTPRDPNEFYLGILDHVVAGLALDVDVSDWWEHAAGHTPNQRVVAFFRDVAMPAVTAPVVVFLDEIDATLKLPFSDDLFTAIRTLFNGRPDHPATRELTFCLLGTATPSELIKDRRTTPYNIGHTLELVDFDPARDDLTELERVLSRDGRDGARVVADVLAWTGGHPFLTMTMCRRVLESPPATAVDAVVHAAVGATLAEELKVHFAWINRFMAERLQHGSATFGLYADVLASRRVPPRSDAYSELRLSGLVKTSPDGFLVVRNRIYRERFGKAWLQQARPPRVPRWARRAIVALGAVIVVVVAALVVQNRRTVDAQREVLGKIEVQVAALREAASDDDADKKRDEAAGLIASLPAADQTTLRGQATTAYRAHWARRAEQYRIASKTESSHGNLDEALILAVAAEAKASHGAAASAATAPFVVAQSEAQNHLLATVRLSEQPIHVRRVSDTVVALIGADGLFGIWKIDNEAAPATVSLKTPVALASTDGAIAVAEPGGVEIWQAADPGSPAGNASPLQRIGVLPSRCDSIQAIALDRRDGGPLRIATGCADGRVSVVAQDTRGSAAFLPVRQDTTPYPVFALAFGPRPSELVRGSLRLWADIWEFAGSRPAVRLDPRALAQAVDVRIAAASQRIVVSGLPLGGADVGRAVVYRRDGARWLAEASLEEGRIVASDVTSDGALVATAVQDGSGGGHVAIWEPATIADDRKRLQIVIPRVAPRDVAWLGPGVLVAA
ncbi:MAG TPA: AAA-like domain-containing protein, partial [Kofleriaceae bacterium]|nr:AAA-like domain-containing protein [Kofleriaceae bacterium]